MSEPRNQPIKKDITALRFGVFELDLERQELRRNGVIVHLSPQPFFALAHLARNAGREVTREELTNLLWKPGTFVESDLGLNSCIKKVRHALNDDAQAPRFIETLPRTGYRFIAPVEGVRRERSASSRRRMVLLAVSLVVVGLIAFVSLSSREPNQAGSVASSAPTSAKAPTLVAVMPLQDLRPDAEPYFAAALTETLIGRLARHLPAGVAILDRTSTSRLGSDEFQQPSVSYLLKGWIRGDELEVRATARLVRQSDGVVVWSEELAVPNDRALEVQDEIASGVAGALASELHARIPRSEPPPTRIEAGSTPEATDLYIQGLYLLSKGWPDDLLKATTLFDRALEYDPEFAAAWAGIARAKSELVIMEVVPPSEGFPAAGKAALTALRLDPEQIEARVAIGYINLYYERNFEEAERLLLEARSLAPGLTRPHRALAAVWSVMGRHDEAIREARIARDLDPFGLSVNADLCWYLLFADEWNQARTECGRALRLEPDDTWTRMGLSEALLALGDETGSLETLNAAFEIEGSSPGVSARRRIVEAMREKGWGDPYSRACALSRSGELDEAIESLREAAEMTSFWTAFTGVDPRLDPLREHPEFEAIMNSLGLPGGD